MILSAVVSLWQDIRLVHISLVLEYSYVSLVRLQLKIDTSLEDIIHRPGQIDDDLPAITAVKLK